MENVYPMSDIQVGMVLTSELMRLDGELGIYHDQMVSQIGKVDITLMEKALALLIKKHEVLRTSFHLYDYIQPVQIVHKDITFSINKHNLLTKTSEAKEAYINEFLRKEREENVFDVTTAPLWRVDFFNIGVSDAMFVFQFHHAIMDGWSDKSFRSELMETYFALQENEKYTPTSLAISTKDSVISDLMEVKNEDNRKYWKTTLTGYKRLNILMDERYYRQTNKVYEDAFLEKIIAKCKQDQIAPKSLFFAGYLYALRLFSLEKDLTVGTVANRRPIAEDGDKLLGCFLNTVPFRYTVDTKNQTWETYVKSVANAYQKQQGRDRFSLLEIAKLHQESAEGNPFFDVLFNYVDFYVVDKLIDSEAFENHIATTEIDNLAVSGFERTNTFLDFTANLTNKQLIITTNQTKRFKSGHTVDDLLVYFDNFLQNYVHNATNTIDTRDILPKNEQHELLAVFNDTTVAYDETQTIIDLFEAQVKRTPNATAVVFQDKKVSYQELDATSNQFARYLHKKGVTEGTLVPISMERSTEFVMGVLGILKAGAAYVPIDPSYPKARIEFILNDIAATLVLTQNSLQRLFSGTNIPQEKIYLDHFELFENEPNTAVNTEISPSSLAYIIYTSGTTGVPKGVKITHANVHNLVAWHQRAYELTNESNALLYSGISFDASVWELFPYLLSGGSIFPIAEEVRLDVDFITNFIQTNAITHAYLPTAFYASMQTAETPLQDVKLLLGGEALKMTELPENVEIYNNYGPTENTVVATYHKVETLSDSIPIGKPIDNTQAYILNENLQLVPKGVHGELCLSGKSLSSGYLHRDELTAEKFVAHPFKENERVYKTGDIAKWLPNGKIEFVGRQDNQLQIRGYRVELGEIETALTQLETITQSVVIAAKDVTENNQLIAYFTSESVVDIAEIQSKLAEKLPSYMIPKLYMQLDEFPLTANGKIDRNNLPELDKSAYKTNTYVAPTTQQEKQLVAIWEELLNLEHIGIQDDFFELGGHSLLAIRLSSHVKATFGVVVSVRDIFTTPTIKQLVTTIANATLSNVPKISVQERPKYIPLSYAQERLWFVDKLQGSNTFHIPGVLRLNGELNITLFKKTMKTLVQRHEALRTVFKEHNGVGYQQIIDEDAYEVAYISEITNEASLSNVIDGIISKPFDLAHDFMLRTAIIKESEDNHILVLVAHHIASDGWSLPILVKEIEIIYQSLLNGEAIPLAPLPVQYADYSIWQRHYLSGEVLETKLAYWLNKLKGAAILELPTDFSRPEIQSLEGRMYRFTLEKSILDDLNTFSKENGTTLFMTLLSIYKVLLYKYSGQVDISVGTPIANREQLEISQLIGFFVNNIVLRDTFTSETRFNDLVAQVKQTCLDAYSHQDVPFERIVDHLGIERDQSRSTLFQTEFILQNNEEVSEMNLGESQLEMLQTEHKSSQFDILMNATETPFGLAIGFEYATALFKKETIMQMAVHFEQLIHAVLKDANQPISALEMLTADEKVELLETFNNTTVTYEKQQTVVDLFEAQAIRVPNATAVISENKRLTYKELNEKANQFARHLRKEYNIQANDLVGVMMNRSEWAIISILGILKSGAAYVPIDIEFPESRKQFIVEESGLKVLVINSDSLFDVLEFNTKIISIDIEFDSFPDDEEGKTNLIKNSSFSDLAYIIYTSGSTGNPKGVMVMHENFANMVVDHSNRFDITEKDAVSQFTSFSFDVSASEIFMSLISGSSLVMLSKSRIEDGESFVSYLQEKNVTIAHIPPSYLISLHVEKLAFIKVLVVGGEAANLDVVYTCAKNSEVYNAYGPTECTVCSSIYKVDVDNQSYTQLPIGTPISNTQIYILDQELQLVPKGVIGELCIAGTGVTKGYLNQPELTAEKFIPNPFKTNELLYKTGDLAKWSADGTIEFIGRKDYQVKIRGYRIELGEIEAALEEVAGVQQAAVLARENDAGIKELIAYVTLEAAQEVGNLKDMLHHRLPEYMVPKVYVKLESFPLTASSKIDRKALPDPEASAYQTQDYVAPTTAEEIKLAAILQELLGVKKVGIHDNFFELGGHSVLAIRLVSHIQSKFRVAFNVKDVFATPTVAALAITIREGKASEVPPILAKERPKYIPLSFAQERLWFIDALQGSVAYHMPEVMRIKGGLDIEILSQALKALVQRHESLRTVVKEHEGIGYQHIIDSEYFEIAYHDTLPENIDEFIAAETATPFDLSEDYMLRVTVVKEDANNHILIFVLHHIASDGWSIPLFVNELEANYERLLKGETLAITELPIQYADYSIWQREYLSGEVLQNKMAYWKNKLEGAKPLELPADFTRPALQSLDGNMHQFMIDGTLQQKLKELSQENGATVFMTLLSIYKILLYRYTGNTDISVGSPIANREQAEIAELIGFFINTLVLRDEFESDTPFAVLLEQVKQTCLEAYSHQDIPFEFIVDHLEIERDQSRSPLFQTLFALQNNEEVTGMNLGESKLEMMQQEFTTSKFDLSFNAVETNNGIACSITYTTALFKKETIQRMAEHFVQLIHSVLDDIDQPIDSLQLLTATENEQLVAHFGNAKTKASKKGNLVHAFESQVEKTPTATAIIFEGNQLTYQELDAKANQVANCLLSHGITTETLVPICVNPSFETLIGILGILKAGAAYVPVDSSYPAARISYILNDTKASVLLSSSNVELPEITKTAVEIIQIDQLSETISTEKPQIDISPKQLAYIIYTSGTTGNPKGVMIEHHSIHNHLDYIGDYYQLTDEDTFVLFSNTTFDASIEQLFLPILRGCTLHIVSKTLVFDADHFVQYINEHNISHLHATPSFLNLLAIEKLTTVKRIISGGEACALQLVKRCVAVADFYNKYGPTETTIAATVYHANRETELTNAIPIGTSISNRTLYILDKNLRNVPVGIVGELYIGGSEVARGYLNRPDLTAEKFIESPFVKGERLYKTGDSVRWLADGNVAFIGRQDHQVKIRGYRIELGEIETAINQLAGIKSALVTVLENGASKQLIGYVIADESVKTEYIQAQLQEKLPTYMVPAAIIKLDEFPLTTNGKIDRNKLPVPTLDTSADKKYVAPTTPTEIGLVNVWQELLNIEKIGIHDNFFELGGDSIMAIQLVSRSKTAGYNYNVRDIFSHQTIAKISGHLKSNIPILQELGTLTGEVPLHPIQKEFFTKKYEAFNHYNQSVLLKIAKKVPKALVEVALQQLVSHHDALRFTYAKNEHEVFPTQSYSEQLPNLHAETVASLTEINDICEKYQASLAIFKGELLKAVFITTPETEAENRCFITIHHLAIDGVSWRILLEDLTNTLENLQRGTTFTLPEKGTSYRQWTEKLTEYTTSETLTAEFEYWRNIVANYAEVPVDNTYDELISFQEVNEYSVRLDAALTKQLLQNVHQAYQTEINDILLSALALTCKNWMETSHVVIALEGHGREELFDALDINRTVGWFTSIYPVSLAIPSLDTDYKNLINSTKVSLRNIPNKGIGFGILRHLSDDEQVKNTLAAFKKEIIFNYLGNFENSFNTAETKERLIGFASESSGTNIGTANKHANKLVINSLIQEGCLQLNWSYDSKRYNAATIEKLANTYISSLEKLISHCNHLENQEDKHLVVFQQKGLKAPLFMIPPLGGTSFVLENFASQFTAERPIYGVEMEGIFEGEAVLTTMEAIAAKNIARIKTVQPTGPYIMAGYSFGGSVVYEMAKQLEREGEEVVGILLDQAAYVKDDEAMSQTDITKTAINGISEAIKETAQEDKLPKGWEDDLAAKLDTKDANKSWQMIMEYMEKNHIVLPSNINAMGRIFKLFIANISLDYKVTGNIKNMILVKSEREVSEDSDFLRWDHFNQHVHMIHAKGNHHTMLQEANGKELASKIQSTVNTILTK
ncbi:non-ribosomal peptide synthetase [Kordia jejudonensis]|uniref:non-ribosomal peptide synthetase n=1 Tax=Kordia jejudonensis TaxID=1348245 RepID=UPI0021CEA44A|nr:non-ribosomal peptide synthetase [Kordia jejudonensis]